MEISLDTLALSYHVIDNRYKEMLKVIENTSSGTYLSVYCKSMLPVYKRCFDELSNLISNYGRKE